MTIYKKGYDYGFFKRPIPWNKGKKSPQLSKARCVGEIFKIINNGEKYDRN